MPNAYISRFVCGVIAALSLSLHIISHPAYANSAVIIDDFNDGDTSDWGFFGGNLAGGGGGPLDDRPQEGTHYFTTGWGGAGSDSAFYGGAFKNFDNMEQVTPPTDPWINFWVYLENTAENPTDADQFTLEVTLREDTDGNGWTDGSEDSIRLDTTFSAAEFDNSWRLISAPLSDLVSLNTGGDGNFNGNLDEIVIVIAGVQGADPSQIQIDFDFFAFSSGGPLESSTVVVFDDMEHGDPFGNGWFSFNSDIGGGGIAATSAELPPNDGGSFALNTGWGSGGAMGFYGGFGRGFPTNLDGTAYFNFWINPQANQEYTLEINLQEDDNSDDSANAGDDDEFQYNCVVSDSGPCAVAGGGWQLVSIPLADFFDDNSFFASGNGALDAVPSSEGGNGQLINIVFAVIGSGSDVNFDTDYWVFSAEALADGGGGGEDQSQFIDDFEYADSMLPSGTDADAIDIGFQTFSDGSAIGIALTDSPPAPLPDAPSPNSVLAMTGTVDAFAGFVHLFENETADTWTPQDWSAFAGFRVWIYGQNTGTTLFIDIIDDRTNGSTTDDAERFSVEFTDDFSGWQQLEFPFSSFNRKEIGNGAPNNGFTLTNVHGWALGMLNTGGNEVTYYVDNAEIFGTAVIPDLAVTFTDSGYAVIEGDTANITVALNRPMNSSDPETVSVDFTTETLSAIPDRDFVPTAGVLTFVNGGASEMSFPLETLDDNKWQGTQSIGLVLENPVDVALGFTTRATAFLVDDETFDPNLEEDFERGAFLWNSSDTIDFSVLELSSDDPRARPGQGAFENVLEITSLPGIEVRVRGNECPPRRSRFGKWWKYWGAFTERSTIRVAILTTDNFDAQSVDHTTVMLGNAKPRRVNRRTGEPRRILRDVDRDGDLDMVFHFLARKARVPCETEDQDLPLTGQTLDGEPLVVGDAGGSLNRDFAAPKDWTQGEALSFWLYGNGSGESINVEIKDNRAPDPGPEGWSLVWSEEFNEPAGTPPNPDIWSYEIGDGSINGIPGWGNDELQYYTDELENAATDGQGNMVLTVREADGTLDCYYGPCDYTSARLITKNKAEFAYGRIESRILVPEGVGIWPAFWSLGTDIDVVNWPQTGEIDFMEFVGRLPNEIFGTIHGPGYAGGASFGNIYDFGEPVFNNYHTFVTEWQPDLIKWYVDGILYHTATPADVAPNPWVFNDAIFMLLNVAIGGNFGGAVDPNIELPASMAVDYIRVYQGDDTAERFEATVVDDFVGWQKIEIPFSEFTRSADQPDGAPDDGLNLNQVWGYGFDMPSGEYLLDEVRVEIPPAPTAITVSSLDDAGVGSLRQALTEIANGGVITIDASLANQTLSLTTAQLLVDRDVIINGAPAPGFTISGNNAVRVLQVAGGVSAVINDITIADGAGAPQGGGILNLGTLTLERVTVRDNVETSTGGPSFDLGGGGIYNGDGATLNLSNSTVANNSTTSQPGGGIYGFFNSTVNITNSTVSGNVGADVAGGLRSLGNANVTNSTFSGNTSTAWHGGGIFHTDGQLTVSYSTFAENISPANTASGILVATFGNPASMTVSNSILQGSGASFACAIEGGSAATINSAGGNVISDGSCEPIASDSSNTDAQLMPLANNGGNTSTHALMATSPAIDFASGSCPATDQRGEARPQGAACDSGAVEATPAP